jgi:cell division control protein 7
MAAAARRLKPSMSFTIREDTPTDDAAMAIDEDAETEERTDMEPDEGDSENESSFSESGSSEEEPNVSDQVTQDMIKLQEGIPGFKEKFRLIKRIGEGTMVTSKWVRDWPVKN